MTTTGSALPPTSAPRRRRRWAAMAAVAVVVAVVVVLLLALRPGDDDPLDGRDLYAWPSSSAAAAAAGASGDDQEVLARLAAVPTAIWLTPEAHPSGEVGDFVRDVVLSAHGDDGASPVFVVYGITDRDCATEESSGGLPADQYVDWVTEIAGSLDRDAVVVLEPDALATLDQCPDPDQRVDLLGGAVDVLADGPTTYLDAGHSDWVAPATMAERLEQVGVDEVRGFSTNVANYQTTEDEQAYGEQIVDDLADAGDDDAHFVVDTSRNGAGATDDWCNPPGRAIGDAPSATDDGALDATLWIKPPGESDGTCHGGPPAGQFWPSRALELARAAGW